MNTFKSAKPDNTDAMSVDNSAEHIDCVAMAVDNSAEHIDCAAMTVEHSAKEFDTKEMTLYNEAETFVENANEKQFIKYRALKVMNLSVKPEKIYQRIQTMN